MGTARETFTVRCETSTYRSTQATRERAVADALKHLGPNIDHAVKVDNPPSRTICRRSARRGSRSVVLHRVPGARMRPDLVRGSVRVATAGPHAFPQEAGPGKPVFDAARYCGRNMLATARLCVRIVV